MAKIVSLDPGGKTGWALFQYTDETEPELLDFGQVDNGLQGFIEWFDKEGIDEVVCESFTLRPGVKFPDLSPVQIIGALEAILHKTQVKITYQPPSSKPLCDDDRLKSIGMHKPGLGHANDAIRHGIIYLRKIKHMPTIRRAWPKEE